MNHFPTNSIVFLISKVEKIAGAMMKVFHIFVLATILMISCNQKPASKKEDSAKSFQRRIVVLSTDDSLAGTSEGWTLNSEGMVIHWVKNLGSALFDETPFKVDSLKVQSLIQTLEKTGIPKQKIKPKGKRIHHLIFKKGNEVIRLSWTEKTALPKNFIDWYNQTQNWFKQLKTTK